MEYYLFQKSLRFWAPEKILGAAKFCGWEMKFWVLKEFLGWELEILGAGKILGAGNTLGAVKILATKKKIVCWGKAWVTGKM